MNVFLSLILLCISIIHNGLLIEFFIDSLLGSILLGAILGLPVAAVLCKWEGNSYISLVHYLTYYFFTGLVMGSVSF